MNNAKHTHWWQNISLPTCALSQGKIRKFRKRKWPWEHQQSLVAEEKSQTSKDASLPLAKRGSRKGWIAHMRVWLAISRAPEWNSPKTAQANQKNIAYLSLFDAQPKQQSNHPKYKVRQENILMTLNLLDCFCHHRTWQHLVSAVASNYVALVKCKGAKRNHYRSPTKQHMATINHVSQSRMRGRDSWIGRATK